MTRHGRSHFFFIFTFYFYFFIVLILSSFGSLVLTSKCLKFNGRRTTAIEASKAAKLISICAYGREFDAIIIIIDNWHYCERSPVTKSIARPDEE